jgi:hypothetical protein
MPAVCRADPGRIRVDARGVVTLRGGRRPRAPEIDRLISEHERYVVHKMLAMAIRVARETDPYR